MALRVEQPAEDAGEREHVVDLVRVVRSSGRHDGGVPTRHDRVDLRVGVGEREHDRPVRHRGDVVGIDEVGRAHAHEDVGTGQDVLQRTGQAAAVGVRRDPLQRLVGVAALGVHDPGDVAHHDVAQAGLDEQPQDRRAGRSRAGHDEADVLDPLVDDPQRVAQGRQHDDRGAVLVVVEHRDVESLAQPRLDLEAARRRDVLEVDAGEAGGDRGDRLDDLVDVLGVEAHRPGVDVGEALEQRRLALHDRQRGVRTDVAEARARRIRR